MKRILFHYKLVFIIAFSLIISSCSLQKRHYLPGYDLTWHAKSRKTTDKNNNVEINKNTTLSDVNLELPQHNNQEELYSSVSNELQIIKLKPLSLKKESEILNNDSCDVITLKTGELIYAKVIEISPTTISYKRCNFLDGPLIVIEKSSVQSIKYPNGLVEEIKTPVITEQQPKPTPTETPKKTPKSRDQLEYNKFAIASLIMGILSFPLYFLSFFTVPAAIIWGNRAEEEILANPDKYKGLGMARAGRALGYIFASLVLLFLLIFIIILLAIILTI